MRIYLRTGAHNPRTSAHLSPLYVYSLFIGLLKMNPKNPPGSGMFGDLDALRAENLEAMRKANASALPKRKPRRPVFVGGPFPWPQFRLAFRLSGKALGVWQLIHHRARLTKKAEVTLPRAMLDDCGVNRWALDRALADLERIGLISVVRGKGKAARVSLVSLPMEESEVDQDD